MSFDAVPIWALLLGTIASVLLAVEAGVRVGRRNQARFGGKVEVSGSMVGATMGLLAFMLAFTFNNASGRHDARKALVVEEATALDTAWRRSAFLPEPARREARDLVRRYVDLHLAAAAGEIELERAIHESESLTDDLWRIAAEHGQRDPGSISVGLFTQSVNHVIGVQAKRVTAAVRARIPATIWATLGLLMLVGMTMIGVQIGQAGTRPYAVEVAVAVAFSLVIFVIADLDRPAQGLVDVSQAALEDLQALINGR